MTVTEDFMDPRRAERLTRAARAAQALSETLWEALNDELARPRAQRVTELAEQLEALPAVVALLAGGSDWASAAPPGASGTSAAPPGVSATPAAPIDPVWGEPEPTPLPVPGGATQASALQHEARIAGPVIYDERPTREPAQPRARPQPRGGYRPGPR